ncbi:MAG: hypothetical protein WAR21_10645 [Candidatus Acidiferrales bacterium]
MAIIAAVIVAALLEQLLPYLLNRNGLVVKPLEWWVAIALCAFGSLLVTLQIQGARRDFRLWGMLALVALIGSTVLFVISVAKTPPFDVTDFSSINWDKVIGSAQRQVLAEGLVLQGIEVDAVVRSLRRFDHLTVKVVLLDPDSHVVKEREDDESPGAAHDNRARLIEKIKSFQVARTGPGSDLWKERFQLLVRDTYPTMAVIVIDDDLYAYFYPFRKKGTESPVFKFPHYTQQNDPLVRLFEDHLLRLLDPKDGAHPPRDYTTLSVVK